MMRAITNNTRILVVEDNPSDFALMEEFLSGKIENVALSHAKNFKEATEILSMMKNEFDVVLLDLSLPDKTGMPLIIEILKQCQATPVIVITGYSDLEFGMKTLTIGVCDYLLKDELTPTSLHKSILYSCERKKVSFDLKVSEQKLNELFQLSPQPMWVIDLENLRFLKVNLATINQYGYSADEFLLMTIKDIRPATEASVIENEIEKCHNKDKLVLKGNFRHRKRNGEMMMVDVQSNIIEYKGRKAAVILAIDVTERVNYIKELELQIARQQETSWIQSRILKTPIDRIMSLASVLTDLKDGAEKDEMLQHLLKSAAELDSVITVITEKLAIGNGADYLQINQASKEPVKCA